LRTGHSARSRSFHRARPRARTTNWASAINGNSSPSRTDRRFPRHSAGTAFGPACPGYVAGRGGNAPYYRLPLSAGPPLRPPTVDAAERAARRDRRLSQKNDRPRTVSSLIRPSTLLFMVTRRSQRSTIFLKMRQALQHAQCSGGMLTSSCKKPASRSWSRHTGADFQPAFLRRKARNPMRFRLPSARKAGCPIVSGLILRHPHGSSG
jgi:hypothetical protein